MNSSVPPNPNPRAAAWARAQAARLHIQEQARLASLKSLGECEATLHERLAKLAESNDKADALIARLEAKRGRL